MSFLGFWVIRADGSLLLSRRFPTVEKRARRIRGDRHQPLPPDSILVPQVLAAINSAVAGVTTSPTCSGTVPLTKYDAVVPFFFRSSLFYVAIPLLPLPPEIEVCSAEPIELPELTACVSTLEDLAETIPTSVSNLTADSPQLHELLMRLSLVLPFGSPIEDKIATTHLIHDRGLSDERVLERRPAWKPALYKGKHKIQLTIREEVSSMQYDNAQIDDTIECSGSVLCNAEIDGLPDVNVQLQFAQDAIDHVTVHPCAIRPDSSIAEKICFSPPLGLFTLARYGVNLSTRKRPPIMGYYQMKYTNDTSAQFLVQIKLDSSLKNQFEYCEALVLFPHQIADLNAQPSSGTASIASDQNSVIWNIGSKFSGKGNEMSLAANLSFDLGNSTGDLLALREKQPAFVRMRFCLVDDTLSGISINQKAVTVYPATKFNTAIAREVRSGQYVIWNSLTPAPHVPAADPSVKLPAPQPKAPT